MGLFDKIKDAANVAGDMVAKANELVDKSDAALAGIKPKGNVGIPVQAPNTQSAPKQGAVPAQSAAPVQAGASGGKMAGMLDQCGCLLIHDEDELVDAIYFPDPTDIREVDFLDYFDEELVFDNSDDRTESGEFWRVESIDMSFDEKPGVIQGQVLAFIPNIPTCHAFYGLVYVDDDGDLRFDMRRQYNPAAVITPADAKHYDALKETADGLLKTEELFGWTLGAGKRIMEAAYYDPAEVVAGGSCSERPSQQPFSNQAAASVSSASLQPIAPNAQITSEDGSVARALALVEMARQGVGPYVSDPVKEKRFADLKAAIGFVKNHFLQSSEGFKLLDETNGTDMYVLTLENAHGDIQYTLATGNRGGSTSLNLTAMVFAGVLRDDVSELDVHHVFDAMYKQTLLSFFGPARLCPHVIAEASGERTLVAVANTWFTGEIRRLDDPGLFARSEFVVPTLLASRIDVMETMFHDPVVTAVLAALCK